MDSELKEKRIQEMRESRQKTGGLHLNFRKGDRAFIEHGGETMEIIFQGKAVDGLYSFTFVGPRSFAISNTRTKIGKIKANGV